MRQHVAPILLLPRGNACGYGYINMVVVAVILLMPMLMVMVVHIYIKRERCHVHGLALALRPLSHRRLFLYPRQGTQRLAVAQRGAMFSELNCLAQKGGNYSCVCSGAM